MMPPPTTRTTTRRMAAKTLGISLGLLCPLLGIHHGSLFDQMLAPGCGEGMEAAWRYLESSIDSVTFHCHDMAMPDDDRYSLTELADLAGVTPRTVRYYLAQGLLPAVGQTGPGSKYGETHLARLRLIRRLQAEHLPLAEIRRRLEGLSGPDILTLAAAPAPPVPTDSALDYVRTVLGGGAAGMRSVTPPPAASQAPPPGMPLLN